MYEILTLDTGGNVAETNIEKFIGRMEAKMENLETAVSSMKEELGEILNTVSEIRSDAKVNHNEQNSRHENRDKNCVNHTHDIELLKERQSRDFVRMNHFESLIKSDKAKEGAVQAHEKTKKDNLLFKIAVILFVMQVFGVVGKLVAKKFGF